MQGMVLVTGRGDPDSLRDHRSWNSMWCDGRGKIMMAGYSWSFARLSAENFSAENSSNWLKYAETIGFGKIAQEKVSTVARTPFP